MFGLFDVFEPGLPEEPKNNNQNFLNTKEANWYLEKRTREHLGAMTPLPYLAKPIHNSV